MTAAEHGGTISDSRMLWRVGWRTRVLIVLARRFGPTLVLPTLDALEQADSHGYDGQPETAGTPLPSDERSHARLLREIAGDTRGGLAGAALARFEGRHRATSSGNSPRAAVLGVNDGLLSNFSLVMGVAGADLSGQGILIAGLAGLLAGAGSMAMGDWISVQSSRELYVRQIDVERAQVAEIPDEEEEELALIYQAKGLSEERARALAERLMADRSSALDTLAREELGGSAWQAAADEWSVASRQSPVASCQSPVRVGSALVIARVAGRQPWPPVRGTDD